jgi:prepilin-type N-terminal cleavage/methylation domain-containing protein
MIRLGRGVQLGAKGRDRSVSKVRCHFLARSRAGGLGAGLSQGKGFRSRARSLSPKAGAVRRGRITGFTLIETLVAVSIFGTIAATIYLSFSTGMEAQSRVEAASENLSRAGFALELMAEDLQSPGRISPGVLEGWDAGFRMALWTTSGNEERGVLEEGLKAETIEYRLLEKPGAGRVLVRRLLRGEQVLSEAKLLGGVRSFRIDYFSSDLGGLGSWVEEWESAEGLPYAVRVKMSVSAEGESSEGEDGISAKDDEPSVKGHGSPYEYRRLIALAPSWLRPPVQSTRLGGEDEQ